VPYMGIGLSTVLFCERDQQEFLAAGVDEFIEKPLSPDWLVPS
jgi:CheY-like chemotaxis protein